MDYSEKISVTYCECSCFGLRLMPNGESKALLATVGRGEGSRAGCQVVHRAAKLLRQACLKDGLIGVPGFPDGELLRPSAGPIFQGREDRSGWRHGGCVWPATPVHQECSTPRPHTLGPVP